MIKRPSSWRRRGDPERWIRSLSASGFEWTRFASSNLIYLAAIGFRERYTIGKQRFQRVYVAQINLGWDIAAPGEQPAGFMLNKIVVLNGDRSVAALFDDHPVNKAGPLTAD